jgi:hypothetical protein
MNCVTFLCAHGGRDSRALFDSACPYHRRMSQIGAGARDAGPRDAGPRDAGPRDAGPAGTGGGEAGLGEAARADMTWDILRRRLRPVLPALYPIEMAAVNPPRGPAVCAVCRGPVRPGFTRCYQCGRHGSLSPGLLADAVVPISYAVKGTALATDLWRYKSWPRPSTSARTSVLALLLAFLHDHGACVWRHAGMPVPDRLAVVPTGCGRPEPHPLLELASPYLRLPLTRLAIRPGRQGRDLDVHRFGTDQTAGRADVLLIEDSWVSGASAQSAAAALKLAGARHVAIVVIGRHLDPADPRAGPLTTRLRPTSFDPSTCAVHAPDPARTHNPL